MIIFNIKKIRESKNISIRKLASLTNMSKTYLNDLENNKRTNPTLKVLLDIANILEVNVKDLFYTKCDIDYLKEEMYKSIADNGIDAKETLEISQLIDLLINIKMQEELNK